MSCAICSKRFKKIHTHIKKEHGLNIEEYIFSYNKETLCAVSRFLYSITANQKENIRTRLKRLGMHEELNKLNRRTSAAVSRSIMENETERLRRSKLLASLNKTEAFRKKASETAKITSLRPEIIAARTQQLLNKKRTWQSKPESDLFDFIKSLAPDAKRNQRIQRSWWKNLSKRHQLDIFDEKQSLIIEYDGPCHFKPIYGDDAFLIAQRTDFEVNTLSSQGYTIIRVGYDQYKYRGFPRGLTDIVKFCIKEILNKMNPGLYQLGAVYGKNNFL